MKNLIATILLGMFFVSPNVAMSGAKLADVHAAAKKEASVYICTGRSSKRYHSSSSCRGLRRCSGEIIQTTKSDAESRGKTPCKICY